MEAAPHPVAERVLAWYQDRKRDLPWRRNRDPYRVWVSEAMLQQTRVDTVIPYFSRFIGRFPTVAALAAADVSEVLKYWENLGYYARARNLHRAAKIMVEKHGGRVPSTPEELIALPGIGPYMAGAVLSMAHGRPTAAVDGNVRRILCRVYGVDDPVDRPAGRKRLDKIAAGLVPDHAPGDFNQGLMDLGAAVCRPQKPDCGHCPLSSLCRAFQEGRTGQLPVKSPRRAVPAKRFAAGVVLDDRGRALLARRPENGLLGGLWAWPAGELKPQESPKKGVARVLAEEFGLAADVLRPLGPVKHAYTHFTMTLYVFVCRLVGSGGAGEVEGRRWANPADLVDLAMSKADRLVSAAWFASEKNP